jgi:hypothetical protein
MKKLVFIFLALFSFSTVVFAQKEHTLQTRCMNYNICLGMSFDEINKSVPSAARFPTLSSLKTEKMQGFDVGIKSYFFEDASLKGSVSLAFFDGVLFKIVVVDAQGKETLNLTDKDIRNRLEVRVFKTLFSKGLDFKTDNLKLLEKIGLSPNAANFDNGITSGMNKTQKQNFAALQKLARQDPNFLPTLVRESRKRGINPDYMLNMIALESSFNKTATYRHAFLGLGMLGRDKRRRLGWSGDIDTDLERVQNMTASQQLDQLVFPFVDKEFGGATNGITMDKLYAGWGSGHFSNNPNYVLSIDGGKRNAVYDNNPQWDVNKDGMVQQWELGEIAFDKLGAGKHFSINE